MIIKFFIPFFIRPCKSADLQTCCCATHVNFRNTVEALIGISKQFNSVYGNVHPDDDIVPAFNSYRSFMGFIYRDCHRDEFGLLVQKYESGECENWASNFLKMKSHINKGNLKTSKGFVRFEYQDDGNSRKLQLIETPMTSSEIILYIESKLKKFIQHWNDAKHDYLFWKRWNAEIDLSANAILTVDFSENLSLPIYKEPQTMYWVRKQISLHCGVGMFQEGEDVQIIYFGHVSEDREHDQPLYSSFN